MLTIPAPRQTAQDDSDISGSPAKHIASQLLRCVVGVLYLSRNPLQGSYEVLWSNTLSKGLGNPGSALTTTEALLNWGSTPPAPPFQAFRRTLYPRLPGPMCFAQWFTDPENGCGTGDTEVDEREGAKKIMEFFIAWKAELQKQSEQK